MINRIEVLITGKNIEYFFKELLKENINLYYLDKNKNNIKIIIDYKDYEKILKIKTICKIQIIKYYGLGKIKNILKRNYYVFLCIILGILLNILLSTMILKIEIITPNKELKKIVMNDLKTYGIEKYRFKINYKNKEKIKEKILKKEKDTIEWIEIEEHGTKYIVKIEERKKQNESSECSPRHIISKKKAIIISISSSSGEIKKKINDYVEKGDILISGFIYNKDEIKTKRCAVGRVYGETWYKVTVTIPKIYIEKELINNYDYGLSLNIFKKKYIFFNKLKKYQENVYNIIEDSIIPINFSIGKYQELNIIKKKYNLNNISKIALKEAENKMKKQLKNDELVISKKVLKKTEKNSKIEVEVFFKIKENITDYLDITNVDINNLNNKEE